MSGSPNEMHIQMELPTPTHHHLPWPQDCRHPYPQIKHAPHVQNGKLTWNHSGDFVAIAEPDLTNLEPTPLPSNFVASQTDPATIQHHNQLDRSFDHFDDLGMIHERPHSPESSLTDDFSESDLDEHNGDRRGDGARGLTDSQTTGHTEPDGYAVSPSLTRPTTIRFRSRVRITSGLSRHRQSRGVSTADAESRACPIRTTSGEGYFYLTPSSSLSCSPSSSISAPLHSRTDDEADRPGWGPLGRRVSLLAGHNRTRKQSPADGNPIWRECANGLPAGQTRMTETSPLLMPPPRRKTYSRGQRRRRCHCSDCGPPSRKLSPEEVDETFGKWPNRMLNYQWWWWGAEEIFCCRCLDETDDEGY